jgi:hypothetical protein
MSFLVRSLVAASLLVALGAVGCGETKPEATPDASGSAAGGKKLPPGTLQPAKRIDPLVMKTYRAESCYFGTLSRATRATRTRRRRRRSQRLQDSRLRGRDAPAGTRPLRHHRPSRHRAAASGSRPRRRPSRRAHRQRQAGRACVVGQARRARGELCARRGEQRFRWPPTWRACA